MQLRNLIRRKMESFRVKYMPALAELFSDVAIKGALSKNKKIHEIGILLDNGIHYNAITHETAWVSTGKTLWGPEEIDSGYLARIPVHGKYNKSREYTDVKYICAIAHLARRGHLKLWTSSDLIAERLRQPVGRYHGYGYFDFDVLQDLKIEPVDGYNYIDDYLGDFDSDKPEDVQRNRIRQCRSDKRFDALVKQLGENNSQDAYHIHTAETNSLYCFLTMDYKLLRNVKAQQRGYPFSTYKTKVMSPSEFGKQIGLYPIAPIFYSYTRNSFIVRSDLVIPGEKRMRWKKSKSR